MIGARASTAPHPEGGRGPHPGLLGSGVVLRGERPSSFHVKRWRGVPRAWSESSPTRPPEMKRSAPTDPGARAAGEDPRDTFRALLGTHRTRVLTGHASRGGRSIRAHLPRHIERGRGVALRRDPERVSSVATLSHSAPPDDEDRGRARSYGRHSDDGLPLPALVARSPPRNHPSSTGGDPGAHGRARRQTGAPDTEAAQRSMRPRAGGEIRRPRSGVPRMSRRRCRISGTGTGASDGPLRSGGPE